MVYRYLLFFDREQVMVINYEERDGKKLHYITNQGERQFPFDNDFWAWWKAAVSYIDGEVVDFCFLYDKEYSILNHPFPAALESCWNQEILEDFFMEMTEYSHLSVRTKDNSEIVINNRNLLISNNIPMVFYTNIPLKTRENTKKTLSKEVITPFARYCREQLKDIGKKYHGGNKEEAK